MTALLEAVDGRIPNFAGIKFFLQRARNETAMEYREHESFHHRIVLRIEWAVNKNAIFKAGFWHFQGTFTLVSLCKDFRSCAITPLRGIFKTLSPRVIGIFPKEAM